MFVYTSARKCQECCVMPVATPPSLIPFPPSHGYHRLQCAGISFPYLAGRRPSFASEDDLHRAHACAALITTENNDEITVDNDKITVDNDKMGHPHLKKKKTRKTPVGHGDRLTRCKTELDHKIHNLVCKWVLEKTNRISLLIGNPFTNAAIRTFNDVIIIHQHAYSTVQHAQIPVHQDLPRRRWWQATAKTCPSKRTSGALVYRISTGYRRPGIRKMGA